MAVLEITNQLLRLSKNLGSDWIIDGGCHFGEFACSAIKTFPSSNILSFEPDPNSWAIAKKKLVFTTRLKL